MHHHHGDNHQHHDHHDHHHGAEPHKHSRPERVLLLVLILNIVYMFAEVIGGWLANSLALLSDAGHMFTDVAALALSLLAARFASRPANPHKTYGYYRMEILAALANGVTLIAISVLITIEAYQRLRHSEPIAAPTMIAVSVGGLIVNLISAKALHANHEHNLNLHGAFLHVIGDLLGSVVAVIAGVLVLLKGWLWPDPVFSVLICLLIVYSSWRLVKEAVNVLLEGTPSHIDARAVEASMLTVGGVREIHDLHIWTITSNRHAVTAHVIIDESRGSSDILRELRQLLASKFGLSHSTLQLEDPYLSAMVKLQRSQTAERNPE